MAVATFWRVLVDPEFAAAVAQLRRGEPTVSSDVDREARKPTLVLAEPNAALQQPQQLQCALH